MIGNVQRDYAPNAKIYMASGRVLYGSEQMSIEILQRLCAFPDTKLIIDDVIVTGDERKGYSTSVRLRFEGTNTGPSIYGQATGNKISHIMIINSLVIVNYPWHESRLEHCKAMRVNEFIQYDELNIIKQLGFEPVEIIARLHQMESDKNQFQNIVIHEIDRFDICLELRK